VALLQQECAVEAEQKLQADEMASELAVVVATGRAEITRLTTETGELHDQVNGVTSRPNKDEFEPTSGPSVSGMACVGNCPTLLVEGESHQHINPSAKCISTPGLTLLREVRTKA
jgi:hypothetical protein